MKVNSMSLHHFPKYQCFKNTKRQFWA